jgi:hypothetical protein
LDDFDKEEDNYDPWDMDKNKKPTQTAAKQPEKPQE